MSIEQLAVLLDEIASLVNKASTGDKTILNRIMELLVQADQAIPETRKNSKDLLVQANLYVADLILDNTSDADADRDALGEIISEIAQQYKMPSDATNEENDPPFPQASSSTQRTVPDSPQPTEPLNASLLDEEAKKMSFSLPEHVDEEIFFDFLNGQIAALQEIEANILALENGDCERLSDIRRRLHTLKGEAGVIGLTDLEYVCHELETILESPRNPKQIIETLLTSKDWMGQAMERYRAYGLPEPSGKTLIATIRAANQQDVELDPSSDDVIADEPYCIPDDEETNELLNDFLTETEERLQETDTTLLAIETEGQDEEKVNKIFRIFHSAKGVAGFLSLRDIISLAHETETMLSRVQTGDLRLEGEVLDLCFDATEMLRNLIHRVHRSLETDRHLPSYRPLFCLVDRIQSVVKEELEGKPEAKPDDRLGDILTRPPVSIPAEVVEQALASQKETGRRLGEELVISGKVPAKKIDKALRAQQEARQSQGRESGPELQEIKVDVRRVDNLVELVGELAVVESMIVHLTESMIDQLGESARINLFKARTTLRQFRKISKDLQDVGLQMRMVPLRSVFQKMARLVRDLSKKQSKPLKLQLSGENTEMDRSMVERIADPLVHLMRNAADHGIETPDQRRQAGKSEEGVISLSAFHQGGNVIIEIRDDGRGLNREAIRRKAIANGLLNEHDNPQEKDLFNLIFEPGFSTAQKVSEVSGRGVGMDVVKRNIESMHGRISIQSKEGEGTVFQLVLPLTLAIIDGMLIKCGAEQYIVPTLAIVESLQPPPEMIHDYGGRDELLRLRGELIPLVRLDYLLKIEGERNDRPSMVMVVESAGEKIGLVVEEILQRQQVVIKNLTAESDCLNCFSGAAILSDGRVGLILNTDQLRRMMDMGLHRRASNSIEEMERAANA